MSLDLDALRTFARVAELRSFTAAAERLGMPKARASAHVQKLEADLGARLLQRSTRVVHLTPEGEQLLSRARGLLTEADEVGSMFSSGGAVRGRVRVELPLALAREIVVPRVPELLARHPQLELDLRASDQLTPALREGRDVVLRIGPAREPGLVGRRIGELSMINCASPSYLRQHGTPHTLEDLAKHLVVHYSADPAPVFEYFDGAQYRDLPMRSVLTVDTFDSYIAACVAGLGIAQIPRHPQGRHADRLVEVLPELNARPSPVALLHTHGRSAPRRVRAVMSWLLDLVQPLVGEPAPGRRPPPP